MATSRKQTAPAATDGTNKDNDKINDPWDEIEFNYSTSMRNHRDKEDADLAAYHRARGDALRQQLIANYYDQEALLRRLKELGGEYDAGQALLVKLDNEVASVRETRRREREAEDVERRAWFERYRRDGLAYQDGAGEEEGGKDGAKMPEVEGCGDGEMNGRVDAEGLGRELTTVEDPAATVQPATRDDARALIHGAEAVPEDHDVAQGYDGEESALESPTTNLEKGAPHPPVATLFHGQEKEVPQPVEEKVSEAGTLASGQGNEIPTVERDTPDVPAPHDDDTDMGGVEVPGGPELPEDDNEVTSQPLGEEVAVGSPGDNEPLGGVPAKDDVEMLDVRAPPTENETGEVQARACSDCALNHGLYQGCAVLAKPPTKAFSSGSSFTAINKKPPPTKAGSFQLGASEFPEINKAVLYLQDDGIVFAPVMQKHQEKHERLEREEATVPRSLKRKVPQAPKTTLSRTNAAAGTTKPSPSTAGSLSAAGTTGAAIEPKIKIKIINSQSRNAGKPSIAKKPKIILSSPFPPLAATTDEDVTSSSGLECDGYTSTDSVSGDLLRPDEWRLHQVKTWAFATHPGVTQYWHWVSEEHMDGKVIEHQVLGSVHPIKWSVFKKPYNFHLNLANIQEVSFARGSTRIIVTHKKGRDGKDRNPRGDVMAQFKQERTKRRFLGFLEREKGVKITEVGK